MKQADALKRIERQAYRSIFNDGIYDILAGAVLMLMAWAPFFEHMGIPSAHRYLIIVLTFPAAWLVRKHLTLPRLGTAEFGPKRTANRWLLAVIAGAIILLTAPLLIMADGNGPFSSFPVTAVLGGLLVSLAAALMDYPRLYAYAAILTYGTIQSQFLYTHVDAPLHTLLSFGLPAVAIMAFGFLMLYRFLNKYPRPSEGSVHVGQ